MRGTMMDDGEVEGVDAFTFGLSGCHNGKAVMATIRMIYCLNFLHEVRLECKRE